jgi:hypothetical protein
MEVPQGNCLFSYLKQSKTSIFFFFLYKIREQEFPVPAWGMLVTVTGRRGG